MRNFLVRRGLAPCCLLAGMLLGACAGKEEAPAPEPVPADMSVAVEVLPVHQCSRLSPRITVRNAPEGTTYFDVRLVEKAPVERLLGGGSWTNDGSGEIPEGALTRLYSGPCPPSGETRPYVFVVSAMRTGLAQPLAVRMCEVKLEGMEKRSGSLWGEIMR